MRIIIIYHSVLILLLTSPVRTNIAQLLQEDECPLLKNGPILEVAEKICEFCHELTSHEKPNMRAECRAACFSTDAFRSCVNIFSTPTRRHSRSRHRIRHIWS